MAKPDEDPTERERATSSATVALPVDAAVDATLAMSMEGTVLAMPAVLNPPTLAGPTATAVDGGQQPEVRETIEYRRPQNRTSAGMSQPPNTPATMPQLDPDRYEAIGEIARGGLGRIVEVYDHYIGRTIAFKELLPNNFDEARFLREALVTARLEHPAIIPVHEVARWPSGAPSYAMKLVTGRSLGAVIADTKTFEERVALVPHVLAVAEAMAYAHNHRVIHRDLKPENVLVGAFGETVVIDWGLAKDLHDPNDRDEPEKAGITQPNPIFFEVDDASSEAQTIAAPPGTPLPKGARPDESVAAARLTGARQRISGGRSVVPPEVLAATLAPLTYVGAVMGTPQYMPPEQADGKPVNERADVYSIGAILYEVLSGRAPYRGNTAYEVLEAVRKEPPPRLTELEPGTPPDLAAIVDKAMARVPEGRYPTAKELADDLRRFQNGRLVSARHYTRRALVSRWLQRYRLPAGITAGALALLIVLATASWFKVRQERDTANAERALAERRAEHLLISQARGALEQNPAETLAWLKEYPERGTDWTEVREIAIDALSRGVPRFDVPREGFYGFSADGRSWIGYSSEGRLERYALTDGKRVDEWPHSGQMIQFAWVGDNKAMMAVVDRNSTRVHLFDGQHRELKVLDTTLSASTEAQAQISSGSGSVFRLRSSDNGRWLAAATRDGRVELWSAGDWKRRSLAKHSTGADEMDFSADSRYLLSAVLNEGQAMVHPVADGGVTRVVQLPPGTRKVTLGPDGRSLAAACQDGSVQVYDLDGAATWHTRWRHHGEAVLVRYGAKGYLASGGNDGSLLLGDPRGEPPMELTGHHSMLRALEFSHDGRWLASADLQGQVWLWDCLRGQGEFLGRGNIPLQSLEFSPDDAQLAASRQDYSARLWPRRPLRSTHFKVPTSEGFVALYDPSGRWAAIGAQDGIAGLWMVGSNRLMHLDGHRTMVFRLAFAPHEPLLATASLDRTVRLWPLAQCSKAQNSSCTPKQVIQLAGFLWDVHFSPDGQQLVVAGEDKIIHVWPVDVDGTVAEKAGYGLAGHTAAIRAVVFSPDGRTMASASDDHSVRIWDATHQAPPLRVLLGHHDLVYRVAYSPDSRVLASASWDGTVRLWDLSTGGVRVLEGHKKRVRDVVFTADGRGLFSAGEDGTIRYWDVATGAGRIWGRQRDEIHSLALSRDGRYLASASRDRTARLWSVATGTLEQQLLHDADVRFVSFAPDGQRVLTTGGDGQLHEWQLAPWPDVPLEPKALHGWLAAQTNTSIASGQLGETSD